VLRGVTCAGPEAATAQHLQEAIATAVATAPDRISVAVLDWPSATTCSVRGTVRHDAASVVKVTTLATLLWQRGRAGRSLTSTERGWARKAITVSDNDAQTALWARAGGRSGVAGFMEAAGMARSVASGTWGLTQVTAADELRLLREITHGDLLREADRDYLLGLMRRVDSTQRWGVSAGAPAGAELAVKNGWLGEASGWHVHSIGYVSGGGRERALVVLSDGSPSMEEGVEAVERVARAVHGALSPAA
jgi:beta-lactamase class A